MFFPATNILHAVALWLTVPCLLLLLCRFAMYNVGGALLWTVLFLGAGFFFGNLPGEPCQHWIPVWTVGFGVLAKTGPYGWVLSVAAGSCLPLQSVAAFCSKHASIPDHRVCVGVLGVLQWCSTTSRWWCWASWLCQCCQSCWRCVLRAAEDFDASSCEA